VPVQPPFIVVSGGIAAGKSTFVAQLARTLSLGAFLERPEQNPFFGARQQDAFAAQVHFLLEAVESSDEITSTGAGGVQERSAHEQVEVFARARYEQGLISRDELGLLRMLSDRLLATTRPPDLVVFLSAAPERLLERIQARGRSAESDLDLTYLRLLETRYDEFLATWSSSAVLRIDAADLDSASTKGVESVASYLTRGTEWS
jgi:deoxyadenosine/deoxycytidine kinase